MTATPLRSLLVFATVVIILASSAGPAAAVTTSGPAPQQALVTEVDLRASLTGDVVVVAGWFEVTATAAGRVDTSTQATDFGGGYDVTLAEPFGEFAFSGEVVGTVNASRVLFAFEGNASSFGGAASVAPRTTMPTADDTLGANGDADRTVAATGLILDAATLDRVESVSGLQLAPIPNQVEQAARSPSSASRSVTPLQVGLFRRLGISLFDAYWQLATLILGLVVVGLLPNLSSRVAGLGSTEPIRTGGAGLAVVLVVPAALLVLGLSLFGIPLALAGGAVYLVFLWVGALYGRFTVGVWLLGAVPRALAAVGVDVGRVENRWAELLVGTAVVGLVVVLPVVGPVVESLVLLLGLGGVTRLAYQSYRRTERVPRPQTTGVVTESGDDE